MAEPETFISKGDFALSQFACRCAPLLRVLGKLEEDLWSDALSTQRIDKPVFVTGLARSGTTILLTLLSQAQGVATHRYRDFPLLFAPLFWNRLQDRLARMPEMARERAHRDGILITRESADAFEEPLWQAFFENAHDPRRCHVLGGETRNPGFEAFFTAHLRKILLLRGGTRYVSKGNYNVARIAYLARLFPDARFVVPIRDPVAHVTSLVRQHALFCRYAASDRRVTRYLEAAGHYEFGPQRRPLNLDPARIGEIEDAWLAGDDVGGYARQWAQVYQHVEHLRRDGGLGDRIMVVRHEDVCDRPLPACEEVLAHCGLRDEAGKAAAVAATLRSARHEAPTEAVARQIWPYVAAVASLYGYTSSRSDQVE
ncbi:MAG: sulfotransferase family protein [Panacagrimonas sp.]